MDTCPQLPSILNQGDCGGFTNFKETAYSIFKNDLVYASPKFHGKNVSIIHETRYEGKERSFWHIVSEGKDDKHKEINIDRTAHLPWIKPLIELQCDCKDYKIWKKFHDKTNKDRWYIWCSQENYIVVLEDRNSYYKLITAFVVDYANQQIRFQKEYENYKTTL